MKLYNPLTEVAIQQRMRVRYERAIFTDVRKELNRVASDIAIQLDNTGQYSIAIEDHAMRIKAIYEARLSAVMSAFGSRVFTSLKSAARCEIKNEKLKFTEAAQSFIRNHTAKRVTQITETTRRVIQSTILEGERQQMTRREIAKAIRPAIGGDAAKYRAAVIAATEIHSASVAAGDMAAASSGYEMDREWISGSDERTREAHSSVNGQTRAMGESFDVGGESLDYPGDPNGSPENIINCRCVLGYSVRL